MNLRTRSMLTANGEMMNITKSQLQRVKSAYHTMAAVAKYRPAAPSDGFGNITCPEEKLNLEREAECYAAQWFKEENTHKFRVGICYWDTRPALIYAIEAARELCGGENRIAAKLLKLAETELRIARRRRKGKDPANFMRSLSVE